MSETITRNVIQNYLRNIDTYDYVFFEYLVSQHTSAHLEDTLSTKVSKQNFMHCCSISGGAHFLKSIVYTNTCLLGIHELVL